MANEEDSVEQDGDESKLNKGKKVAKHDSGAADLEKVTDFVEEAEILSQNLGDTMRAVSDRTTREATEKQMKEKELSKVKINREDVDLIMNEMEIARSQAERKLREHKGNVVDALIELTN